LSRQKIAVGVKMTAAPGNDISQEMIKTRGCVIMQMWIGKLGSTCLLELLDGTLVDTTALVDQVTGGGRLAGIDVADNDDVDVNLVLLTARLSACDLGLERDATSRLLDAKASREER
jgi:hypothetical protein